MASLTAKLVGEGFSAPNAEKTLPIDIQYSKVNEWLVDRKQVPADWSRKLQAIQAKAAEAARELPPGFLGQFEGGEDAPLDYFMARQVLHKLTETAEKSFLGSFKGAAGAWDKVVRAYEYNLIYLGEAAQTLCRNADYEIPFFKKQAAKYQQQLADLEKKKADALKSAAAAAADFRQECQQLGIDSSNIRAGLLGLTAELPVLAGAAVEAVKGEAVTQAVDYYATVVASQQQQQQQQAGGAAAADLLPVLAEVREARTAPPDVPLPAVTSLARPAEDGGSALEVDWELGAALEAVGGEEAEGSSGGADVAAAGISWDLDAADLAAGEGDSAEAPAGISWDVEVEAPAGRDADGAPAGISWDIDISGTGEESQQQEGGADSSSGGAGSQAGGGGNGGALAAAAVAAAEAGESATIQRLVEDAGYRARLLDDLYELRAFLMQRCRELTGKGNELLVSSAPEAVQQVSADLAEAMLAAVDAALAAFSSDKLKQLILLRTSNRYLDRLAAGLQQKAGQESKFQRAAADAEQRRGEIQRQLMADSAKLVVLLKRTRAAKDEIERALSAKLGRRINIMGEVNQLL